MHRNYLLIVFAVLTMRTAYTQNNLKFVRYTEKQGLVNNEILSIGEDKFGFIWFGTKDGLSRFDGIKFKNYSLKKNETDASNEWVIVIKNDIYGNVWFGLTGEGKSLQRYDEVNDSFINETNNVNKHLSKENKIIDFWHISIDSKNRIWLPLGIKYYNPSKDSLTTFIEESSIKDVIEDGKGNTWIVSGSLGLFLLEDNSDSLINFQNNPGVPTSLNSNTGYCIFKDSNNGIWIGTDKGIAKLISYNHDGAIFSRFLHNPDNENSISNNKVYDIDEDKYGNLLIATIDGISIMNLKSGKISRHFTDEIDNQSINSNLVKVIFRDSHDNIWVGTDQGVGKLQNINFRSFSHSAYKNSISHNKVQNIFATSQSKIWLATPKGIDLYDRETGRFEFYTGITKNADGLYGAPLVFSSYDENNFFTGTWGGGFSLFNYKTKEIKNYITFPLTQSILNTFDLLLDHDGDLWITSSSEGVYCYNLKVDTLRHFMYSEKNTNTICSNNVRQIKMDSKGRILFGTLDGLSILLDKDKGIFKSYFPDRRIYQILEYDDGKYWLGTEIGLLRFDLSSEQYKHFILYKKNEHVLGILKDKEHNLWISSSSGLCRFIYKNDDTYEVTSFRDDEGLNVGNFISYSCYKLSDGTMAFGGTKGFCLFKPESIKKDTISPKVIFTDFKINNRSVRPGEEINDQIIIKKSISITEKLELNYKNNAFSIEFTGIQYNMPQYNEYAYFFEGYDKEGDDWHTTNAQNREVKYMNLPAGEYTFKVKAANSYGIWNPVPAVLNISVLPPWWKTWWFRSASSIILIVMILSLYLYRVNALKRQKRVLEQKVLERTSELREANSQLEEKQEEILQQNEEIITVNNQLKAKNEEIEAQKEQIVSSRDQLEKAFKNIIILSEFGQKLTSTFDFDAINKMIFDYVSSLMDTAAFGIGIYNEKRNIIDFPYFMENGKPVPFFYKDLQSKKSLSVRCFKNSEEIQINDLSVEYKKYLGELPEVQTSELPASVIHLPLIVEQRPIGTLTVNSFNKNAYNDNDIANLRTLASYISIALDNSKAYRIIRSKNEQISGSIRYGQTIQQAMLPPKEQIDTYFENFILFRPKDIVSGDFYWFASVNNPLNPQGLDSDNTQNPEGFEMGYYFLAVVDCTGHGVPGAFMSMIGSRLLNDIVIERKIYSPAKILDLLNTMIRKALRQDTTDNHDGMDVCLCRFMHSGNGMQITYAGAKRPLLFYNPETQKIDEIDGTRRSIGGVASRRVTVEFKEQTIQVSNNNIFYLSTDGLIDQCNPQKRKFSQKKLIELLQQINQEPIHEQKKIIENELDSFQKGFEQRDDITLIGVRVKQK